MAEAPIAEQLNGLLVQAGEHAADADLISKLEIYLTLLLRWNARMNLTAVRDPEGIVSRHFVESIICARHLPTGVETLLDFGSGAGFPGIPIALCHPELALTLAESQGKKAAFLQEAVRTLRISAKVHSARAELLQRGFDCVTLRAVDKMPEAVQVASELVAPGGWLVLMTTEVEWNQLKSRIGKAFRESTVHRLNGTDHRILVLVQKLAIERREPTSAG